MTTWPLTAGDVADARVHYGAFQAIRDKFNAANPRSKLLPNTFKALLIASLFSAAVGLKADKKGKTSPGPSQLALVDHNKTGDGPTQKKDPHPEHSRPVSRFRDAVNFGDEQDKTEPRSHGEEQPLTQFISLKEIDLDSHGKPINPDIAQFLENTACSEPDLIDAALGIRRQLPSPARMM